MVAEIKVTPEIDIFELLDAADKEPVVLEQNGKRYRLSRAGIDDNIWAGYDPERLRRTVREMAGSISAEEGERIKKLIYEGREAGTRPADHP